MWRGQYESFVKINEDHRLDRLDRKSAELLEKDELLVLKQDISTLEKEPSQFNGVCSCFKKFKNLEKISLNKISTTKPPSELLKGFIDALGECDSLKEIELYHNRLHKDYIQEIFKIVIAGKCQGKYKKLESLDLTGNFGLKYFTNIEKYKLICEFSRLGIEIKGEYLNFKQTEQELILSRTGFLNFSVQAQIQEVSQFLTMPDTANLTVLNKGAHEAEINFRESLKIR